MLSFREATADDFPPIWSILEPIIRAGEAFAAPRDLGQDDSIAFWFGQGHRVFVAEDEGFVVGTYFIRPNQKGGGSHVANAGYATSLASRGKGVARAMCLDSLARSKDMGFRAMQFNFVVESNLVAVRLWANLGFEVVGRLPGAFLHPTLGYTDVLVMFKEL